MKARVLVVEDSREQRNTLVALLESRGYEVDAVSSGIEALKSSKQSVPDIVILDVVLEDMDGHSVCRWLRLNEATRDSVIIMLTVKNDVKERIEGLHVGADDYLPKPYDGDELEARMYAALRSRAVKFDLRKRNQELEGMLSRAEQVAMTDAVTGLYNRRRFTDVLKREWATAKRYGHALSCAMVDVDNFKQVNDQHGHGAGDEALRQVAELVLSSVREVDLCARYGGDEFAVLFPHTPRDKAVLVMERIRLKLLAARRGWGPECSQVTISVGIASSEEQAIKTADELIEAADAALYDAKREGRDRVVPSKRGAELR
ncbi:MAG: diguanylate cyclase [Myxococcales bacterium]|nr:diguanylate cyclase [Myxococcales bacterium]